MSEIELEIKISLSLNEGDVPEFERFRLDLHQSLKDTGYGSCGEQELTSTGYFKFDCDLTNLHDGLNLLRDTCTAMMPKPKVEVRLMGDERSPIEVFPDNDLLEYLEGLKPSKS